MTYRNPMNPDENPSDKRCWVACASCYRCADKGKYAKCNHCSGRHDPLRQRDPYYIDDRCRCKEGILQYRLPTGQMILSKFFHDPFEGGVTTDIETEDEKQWREYVMQGRERFDDPTWDPVMFNDGTSTLNYLDRMKRGGFN